MEKIRIGHMGISHDHSRAKLATVQKYPEIFEVVGLYEPNDELYEAEKHFPEYASVPRMTEEELFAQKPDAMLIEGFELDLVKLAQKCVDRGIHVHIDKPAGDDIKAFEKLLRDAKAQDLVVQMAYMYRYNPGVQYALEAVKNGTLGEVYEVDAIMDTGHWLDKRKWLGGFNAGIMFFLGCHMVDFIYMFQGIPDKITPYNRSTGFDGTNVIDHGFATFEYKKGVSIARATATEVNGYGRRQLVICGQNGTIEIKPLETENRQRVCEITIALKEDAQGKTFKNVAHPVEIPEFRGRYDDLILDFAAFVRKEKKNPFDYNYELQVQKLILAACGYDIDYKEVTEI